jgi:hypothetical protein
VVVVLVAGMLRAWSATWVCDDAFISYRYAANLVAGHGLVYNQGERVEGYSNFLWTMMLAGTTALGADPVRASQILGLLSQLALLLLALLYGRRLGGGLSWYLPFTALALSANQDMAVWATSGLETCLYSALIFAGFLLLTGPRSRPGLAAAGLCLALAALTRPDGALIVTLAAGWLALGRRWRDLALFLLPVLLTLVPFWVWRLGYYGEFFPNTYYAKSAWLPRWDQGWLYLKLYAGSYHLLPILVLTLALALWTRLRRGPTHGQPAGWTDSGRPTRALGAAALIATGYLLYVVRVGGDFMFARFLIPATPLLYAAVESVLARVTPARLRNAAVLVLLGLTWVRSYPFDQQLVISGIVDERAYYTPERIARERDAGITLRRYFESLPVKLVFFGSEAMLVYYAQPAVAVEGVVGLTDRTISRLPPIPGGRIGHDKGMPYQYLLDRHINFVFHPRVMQDLGYPFRPYQQISFDDVPGRIIAYEAPLMEALRSRGAQFPDFPALLDGYLARMHRFPREKLVRDYMEFTAYYFAHNHDPERQQAFELALTSEP